MVTKRLLKLLILSFLFIGFSETSQAQFWKKLKQKAQEKISKTEDKIINKIDENTDKEIDDTLNGTREETSKEIPKFNGGTSVLNLTNNGYEYVSDDIIISVYGDFNEENISSSQKTYNQDKIIIPVDAYPKSYAMAYNNGGYLNVKDGQIIIHHADATKIVYSIKGTWNIEDKAIPISASFISLAVSTIVDKRNQENTSINKINKTNSTNNNLINSKVDKEIELPSTYNFNKSLEIEITSNNTDAIKMEFLFSNRNDVYAISINEDQMGNQGTIYNVITPTTTTMFMEMSGMKIKKSISSDQFSATNYADNIPENKDLLQKTGATKTILGYNCEEYKYINEGGFVSVWITTNFPVETANIPMLGMSENSRVNGFVLELNSKSGNEFAKVSVVKFDQNKKVTIDTKTYKSMGF